MSTKWDSKSTVKVHDDLKEQLHHLKSKSRVRVSFNELANMSIRCGLAKVARIILKPK